MRIKLLLYMFDLDGILSFFIFNKFDSVRELDSHQVTSNILQDVCVSIVTEHMIYQTILSEKLLTLIHICGVRADPRKLYRVLLQPFLEPQNQNIQQWSHALHSFQTTALCFWGPCPAASKLVSFFCKCV